MTVVSWNGRYDAKEFSTNNISDSTVTQTLSTMFLISAKLFPSSSFNSFLNYMVLTIQINLN